MTPRSQEEPEAGGALCSHPLGVKTCVGSSAHDSEVSISVKVLKPNITARCDLCNISGVNKTTEQGFAGGVSWGGRILGSGGPRGRQRVMQGQSWQTLQAEPTKTSPGKL